VVARCGLAQAELRRETADEFPCRVPFLISTMIRARVGSASSLSSRADPAPYP